MEPEEIWRHTDAQRRDLADLLAGLSPDQWDHASVCPGWRVRDVAAHLTLAPATTVGSAALELVRARGSFNRMVFNTAVRAGARPPEQLVRDLRAIAGLRRRAPGQSVREPLMDILVHGQDITLPLGIRWSMPRAAAVVSADRVWGLGFPFHARRRLRGYRLRALDADWTRGDGPVIEGPIDALLLLLTGRTVALDRLTGDGATQLALSRR
jgi:uncharacterized protein (TIGR03083 family)